MLKYRAYGVADGGRDKNLRGERVYLGENKYNQGRIPYSILKDDGKDENVFLGLCSSGFERNAGYIISEFDKLRAVLNGSNKIEIKEIILHFKSCFTQAGIASYAIININSGSVCGLADGGSVIYEFCDGKLRILSKDGKISFTKFDNFLSKPKIFIALSPTVVKFVNSVSIETEFENGDISYALQRVISRAEILGGDTRRCGFAVTAESDINPILAEVYSDENEINNELGCLYGLSDGDMQYETAAKTSAVNKTKSKQALKLLNIFIWMVLVVFIVVLICTMVNEGVI